MRVVYFCHGDPNEHMYNYTSHHHRRRITAMPPSTITKTVQTALDVERVKQYPGIWFGTYGSVLVQYVLGIQYRMVRYPQVSHWYMLKV